MLVNSHDNKRRTLDPTSFTETERDFLAKLMIFAQQDAIEGKQSHQQQIILRDADSTTRSMMFSIAQTHFLQSDEV